MKKRGPTIWEWLNRFEVFFSAVGAVAVGVWIFSRTFVTVEALDKAVVGLREERQVQLTAVGQVIDKRFEAQQSTLKRMEDTVNRIDERVYHLQGKVTK